MRQLRLCHGSQQVTERSRFRMLVSSVSKGKATICALLRVGDHHAICSKDCA